MVCLSLYPIRPGLHCHNLRSPVLGMSYNLLGKDFERRTGYEWAARAGGAGRIVSARRLKQ